MLSNASLFTGQFLTSLTQSRNCWFLQKIKYNWRRERDPDCLELYSKSQLRHRTADVSVHPMKFIRPIHEFKHSELVEKFSLKLVFDTTCFRENVDFRPLKLHLSQNDILQ
jgi:hypothetical protein